MYTYFPEAMNCDCVVELCRAGVVVEACIAQPPSLNVATVPTQDVIHSGSWQRCPPAVFLRKV